jgi:F-type H+-transporting ATPase subunit a
MLESMLVFIRDQVARPAIGEHDADRFLPFLWTVFFFVLMCNLLGMIPWLGSPTGAIATTGAMALITFGTVIGAGMKKMGPIGFWTGQVPHMDLPLPLAIFLKPMVFVIEILGLFIKHFVLAVRLLANMLAGHLVLAVLLAFIAAAWTSPFIYGVAPATILGATALSLLELFVAFLQAYIFTFLSALFIGMAVHPH